MPADSSSPELHLMAGADEAEDGTELLLAGLDAAYQPIVHLGSGAVIAYEALARPRHPVIRTPLEFFGSLERAGLRLAGERTAFKAALNGAANGLPRVKLFMNASPLTLVDPDFDLSELLELAGQHGLSSSDMVIEVTESEAIDDINALAARVRELRRLGVGVAVDDAGAGHASFRVITHLRPSYIKLDRDLVSNVDGDGARHAFIEAMVRFSRQIGSRLIAEGIETEGELASLAGLGVEAGQGYYLARPALESFVTPSEESRRMIAQASQRLRVGAAQVSIGELARPATVVGEDTAVREVFDRFRASPHLQSLLVERDGQPQAQVTRRRVEHSLALPGGWEELAGEPIAKIANPEPLAVVGQLDIVEVGAILAAREHDEVTEDIVVRNPRGDLLGVASVRDIVRTLAEVQQAGTDDLNPLSGLVGPGWVDAEFERRLDGGEAVTVIFCDVDTFAEINHAGGFSLGDQAIRWLARCLTGVTAGVEGAAVAHMGGDDFALLTPPRAYEELVAELVRSVEGEVMPQLRTELRLLDAPNVFERLGLSLAATELVGSPPPGVGYLDWARTELASPLDTAKDNPGYACVYRSGEDMWVSTWTVRGEGSRRISLGRAEPCAVLGVLDIVNGAWNQWSHEHADVDVPAHRFPGPRSMIDLLRTRYGDPLAEQARAAQERGEDMIEVALEGDEEHLLELLDRLALVADSAHQARPGPVPPELSLLERLLRQRSRVITREDSILRAALPATRT